ncbi:hypothetical protein AMATHDRAFT_74686 [Amanita thiersii Skay4041]|uniref:O-acyltransferase n=1 Tax=Amanita thiersii Skay4041 TaxID=703135 RepID=A0A2A9NVT2_9AGAR|nr:hypothetical protein AMATHDRAFT_74686 [Amanita thiersii Skay4041]
MSSPPAFSQPLPRTESGGFKTSQGTIYVSQPYRSRRSKKLRALVTFEPRKSAFDISNESSVANEFRGFFSLFWISIFIFSLQTYVHSIEKSGRPLDLTLAALFSQDAITLAISDAVLVLSTAFAVPLAIAFKRGWIRYYWTGLVIQHIYQTLVLFCAVKWTFNRQWPWVQSGFLTLHSLVMIMKMHSYICVNGQLQHADMHSHIVLNKLKEATSAVGGWEKAMADVQSSMAELEASSSSAGSTGSPDCVENGRATFADVPNASVLRRRLAAMAFQTNVDISGNLVNNGFLRENGDGSHKPRAAELHPLVNHANHEISGLAKEYSELQIDLISPGPKFVKWPNNIGWRKFAVYMLIPTLVYELEYPRTDRIRPLYIFEKTVATFGTFALLYTVTESFIIPYTPSFNQSFLRCLLDLALPFMISYLLLFYIIFECICNAFAELTFFADRLFYEDWFSRKWNKPVHAFLLRHVYAPTLNQELSKTTAMFLTFLLSACVHELVMVVVTHKLRLYLFFLQLVQIPLIVLSRFPSIKRNRLLGNAVFWLGLYAGFPLLCVAYVAY